MSRAGAARCTGLADLANGASRGLQAGRSRVLTEGTQQTRQALGPPEGGLLDRSLRGWRRQGREGLGHQSGHKGPSSKSPGLPSAWKAA